MKRFFIILTMLLLCITNKSCGWIAFFNDVEKIEKEFIIELEVGDLCIFSTEDNEKIDTFKIDDFSFRNITEYEITQEVLWITYNDRWESEKYFIVTVNPTDILFNYQDDGGFWISNDSENNKVIINNIEYKNTYQYEINSGGDSDTVINKLLYHGKKGILSYQYENGDEYLLDEIIEAE